ASTSQVVVIGGTPRGSEGGSSCPAHDVLSRRVVVGPGDHALQELLAGETGEPEHFLRLHAGLPADLLHALSGVQEFLDDAAHGFEQVRAPGAVVCDRAVDVPRLVPVVDHDDGDLPAETGEQGLTAGDGPAVEAVDDRVVRPDDDGHGPAVR